jgi:hypothetical protein
MVAFEVAVVVPVDFAVCVVTVGTFFCSLLLGTETFISLRVVTVAFTFFLVGSS